LVLSFLLVWLPGCNESEEKDPLLQDIKLRDLAPSQGPDASGVQLLETVNFNVYVFEIPAPKVNELSAVWQMLGGERVKLRHREAFGANSFLVGFGQGSMLRGVTALLDGADARRVQTVSLLLPDGQSGDLSVARLPRGQTVFFTSPEGSVEGRAVGPGELALRIRADRIPRLRGICDLHADGVYSAPAPGSVPQLAARAKSEEFVFGSVGFGLIMAPGDFFLLGPERYVEDQMTLGSYFFSRPGPTSGKMLWVPPLSSTQKLRPYFGPVARAYMVVCTGINY
jgi:hypothetical protein